MPTVVVEPGIRTGVPILIDNPKEVGADRVMNTLAAHHLYGGACVVVDFGTSTNFDAVSAQGEFLGGALAPGIEISLDALAARAAQLRKVELTVPALAHRQEHGRGAAERHGLRRRRPGRRAGPAHSSPSCSGRRHRSVIATGGLAPLVLPVSETLQHHEPDLTLLGLRLVFEKNT